MNININHDGAGRAHERAHERATVSGPLRIAEIVPDAAQPQRLPSLAEVTALIARTLNDPGTHPKVIERIASQFAGGDLPMRELRKALETVEQTRARGKIRTSPGALFGHCIRSAMQRYRGIG